MKKFTKLAGLVLAAALAMGFAACSDDSSEESYTAKYAVGDIILKDGTKVSYDVAKDYDEAAKTELTGKAVAVIFRADTKNDKALGVGLKHDRNGLAWCTNSAKAYSKNITTIQCPARGGAGNLTFTGDTDGSDNLEQIATFLGEENDTTGEGAKDRYPAFYYAKNYQDVTGSHVKAPDYAEGWYLPTIAELFDVWKVKATVDAASELCGGSKFGTSFYWSSSQYASYDDDAFKLSFGSGVWYNNSKIFTYYVCCIRAFN